MNSNKILLVEDDPSLRSLMTTIFTKDGFDVTQAVDGQEALNYAVKGGFAVILTDLKMPNVDGLEFIQKLSKLNPEQPNGPVAVSTSLSMKYVKEEALRRGAAAFIAKDQLEPQEIVDQIKALIAKSQ